MDTFGNNSKLTVDPIDWRLLNQFSEQHFEESLWQKDDELWLQGVFCNNSAAAEAEGDEGDHRQAAANVSAMQALSEQVGGSTLAQKIIKITVEFRRRLTNKKSRCTFHVDPTNKVFDLRALLMSSKAKLPESEGYLFAYRMRVLNENKSFLDQGMVGAGDLNLDVLDNVTTNVSAMQTLSEPVGGSTSAQKNIKIKVELWERLANKKILYTFSVEPTKNVSVLRAFLVKENAQLTEGYLFSHHVTILNEDKSFLDHGMVGVGVPKLHVLDNVTNYS